MHLKQKRNNWFKYISCYFALAILLVPSATYGAGLPVLGQPPAETNAERVCVSLIIADITTGSILKIKDPATDINLFGGGVRLMTALTALDYMQPEDTILLDNAPIDLPQGARLIGFQKGMTVTVNDLIAAMLVYCANDAAVVLGDAVENAIGTVDFVSLMNQKAEGLGMVNTVYLNETGLAVEGQTTSLADQLVFAQASFSNNTINTIMSQFEYQPQTTDARFPDSMTQYSSIMLPEDSSYDSRVTAVARGSDGDETNILIRAQNGDHDIFIFMIYPSSNVEEVYIAASELLTEYMDISAFDFSQYIADKISEFTIGSDIIKLPWKLQEGQPLKFIAYKGFEPDYTLLNVEPNADSIEKFEDGTAALYANVYYQNTFLTEINLMAPVLMENTPDPESTAGPASLQLYESSDVFIQQSFMDLYGWIVYTAAAAILTVLLIAIGKILRKYTKF